MLLKCYETYYDNFPIPQVPQCMLVSCLGELRFVIAKYFFVCILRLRFLHYLCVCVPGLRTESVIPEESESNVIVSHIYLVSSLFKCNTL